MVFVITYFSLRLVTRTVLPHVQTVEPRETFIATSSLDAKIYFNNEVGETGSIDLLKHQIDAAEHTIEIAMFSFGSEVLKDALYAADKRGVQVTLLLNTSKAPQHDKLFSDLPRTIRRIDVGTFDAKNSMNTVYMHHKFMIVDRGFENEILTTGSLNFTTWGEKYNQSFMLVSKDRHLVQIFGEEFDRLSHKVFSMKKLSSTAYSPWVAHLEYPDSFMDVWFSPGYGKLSLKYEILRQIESAEKSLDLMMWDFTDMQIARALLAKARAGVPVRLIAEVKTSSLEDSVVLYLQEVQKKESLKNLEIILDEKLATQVKEWIPDDFSPFIHHHSLIVDKKIIVMGSGNWSLWGFYRNDENAFVTNSRYIVQESSKTFEYFYKLLK